LYMIWEKYFMILKRKWGDKILNEIAKGNADRCSCLVYQNVNFLWIQLMNIMSTMRNTFIQDSHKNLDHHHLVFFLSQKLQWTFLISFPSYALLLQYVNDSSSVFFILLSLACSSSSSRIHSSFLFACIHFKLDSGGSFSDFHFQSKSSVWKNIWYCTEHHTMCNLIY
jgi:hypothetical protein